MNDRSRGGYLVLTEAWLIVFRVIRAVTLLFPTAVVIVVSVFPIGKRGQAMAIFAESG